MNKTDVLATIKKISQSKSIKICSIELSLAAKLVFWGIKRQELCELKVSDVYDSNWTVKSTISCRPFAVLSKSLQSDLAVYSAYLNKRISWHCANSSFLLQHYRYSITIVRHWKKFYLKFDDIRLGGEEFYFRPQPHPAHYQEVVDQEYSKQFGVSIGYARRKGRGILQPSGQQRKETQMWSEAELARCQVSSLDLTTAEGREDGEKLLDETIDNGKSIRSKCYKYFHTNEVENMKKILGKTT